MSYFDLLCRLKPLPEIGHKPPLSFGEALHIVQTHHEPAFEISKHVLDQAEKLGQDDQTWTVYFEKLSILGAVLPCPFASKLVLFEKSLRENLQTQRLKNVWASSKDPLADWKAVEQCRWIWLKDNSYRYQFTLDETASYMQRLVVLARTWRWWNS